MRMRTLGATGLRVSPLGLGLAALGRPGYITVGHAGDFGADHRPAAVAERVGAVLDAAWDAGVRYVDAARSYGRAEEFLAGWLRRRAVAPGRIAVGSKWGYEYTAGWSTEADVHEVKDHGAGALERQWPQTRAHLGPWLGLYQVHSATLESGILDDAAALDALARLRDEEGVAVGVTTSGPRQADAIRRATAIERGGRPLFAAVQATWNPLEQSAGAALSEAHAAGLGVIVKEALANGRLAGRDPGLASLADRLVDAVPGAAGADQAALSLAMAQPFADVVLSGAATPRQVRSNAAAVDLAGAADAAVLEGCAVAPERYWRGRSALPWN